MSGYGDPLTTSALPTLIVKRGDTWAFTAKWRNAEGGPIDLAGVAIRQNLYAAAAAGGLPVLEMSILTGEITLEEDPGQPAGVLCNAATRVEYADMEAVAAGEYLFDQEVTFTDGTRLSTETMGLLVIEDNTQ